MRGVRRTLFPVRQRPWSPRPAGQCGDPSATRGQRDHDVRRDPQRRTRVRASDMGGMAVSAAGIRRDARSGISKRHRGGNAGGVCGIRAPYRVLLGRVVFSRKCRESELRSDGRRNRLPHQEQHSNGSTPIPTGNGYNNSSQQQQQLQQQLQATPVYSYLRASMGLMRLAFTAG